MSLISQLLLGFQAVAAQLKPLLRWRSIRVNLTSTSTGGINTTADHNWLTLSIPANTLQVGDVIEFDVYGFLNKGTGAASLNFFTKWGAAKLGVLTVAGLGNGSFTNRPLRFQGKMTVRTIGATGTLQYAYQTQLDGFTQVTLLSTNAVINTTIANTLTLGCNLTTANASSSSNATTGGIKLW
jgi:hypothetical protein